MPLSFAYQPYSANENTVTLIFFKISSAMSFNVISFNIYVTETDEPIRSTMITMDRLSELTLSY